MAMTLRLSAEETQALREYAESHHTSMQTVARQAIMAYLDDHSRQTKLATAVTDLLARYPDTLTRLGQ